jgi:hypothetical protein
MNAEMINLEVSCREGLQAQSVMADVNLERLFDLQVEQTSSTSWMILLTDQHDREELSEEISSILTQSGLREFELV